MLPLTDRLDRLDSTWSAVRHLNAVVNTPALREAFHANLPSVTAFHADLGQDMRLYRKYRALRDAPALSCLRPPGHGPVTKSSLVAAADRRWSRS